MWKLYYTFLHVYIHVHVWELLTCKGGIYIRRGAKAPHTPPKWNPEYTTVEHLLKDPPRKGQPLYKGHFPYLRKEDSFHTRDKIADHRVSFTRMVPLYNTCVMWYIHLIYFIDYSNLQYNRQNHNNDNTQGVIIIIVTSIKLIIHVYIIIIRINGYSGTSISKCIDHTCSNDVR